jgi:hypothetical protein
MKTVGILSVLLSAGLSFKPKRKNSPRSGGLVQPDRSLMKRPKRNWKIYKGKINKHPLKLES